MSSVTSTSFWKPAVACVLAASLGLLWASTDATAEVEDSPSVQKRLTELEAAFAESQASLLNALGRVAILERDFAQSQETLAETEESLGETKASLLNALERVMDLEDKLACVQVVQEEIEGLAGPHVIFEGCNVHVRNATGATPSIDGTGNLIVGYNEGADADRVGSHNLVVGRFHSYANYGGFVAGEANSVRGAAATVSSGGGNSASGDLASVSGGRNNTASGLGASVSGGDHNEANGELSSVSGGEFNQPSGRAASISGGQDNRASGDSASVSGGFLNSAFGSNSSVSGGVDNLAFHTFSTVSGGVREQTDEQNDHEP